MLDTITSQIEAAKAQEEALRAERTPLENALYDLAALCDREQDHRDAKRYGLAASYKPLIEAKVAEIEAMGFARADAFTWVFGPV